MWKLTAVKTGLRSRTGIGDESFICESFLLNNQELFLKLFKTPKGTPDFIVGFYVSREENV